MIGILTVSLSYSVTIFFISIKSFVFIYGAQNEAYKFG